MKINKFFKNHLSIIIAFIFTGAIICIGCKNAFFNGKFWEINFSSCISILIAIWVSFFLVQKQTDTRNKKEALVKLMNSMQNIVSSEDAYLIDDHITPQSLTMRTRDLNNLLSILKKYSDEFGLNDDIKFIEEHISEYSEIIGNHLTDTAHLSRSTLELQRPLNLIETRLFDMILKLY